MTRNNFVFKLIIFLFNMEKKKNKKEKNDKKKKEENAPAIPREVKSEILQRIKDTEDITEILDYTYSQDAEIRQKASQQLCPCRVQRDIDQFWKRLFELCVDEDTKVRYQILHNICDGSPAHYESQVAEALEIFNRDKDEEIRRRAHKALGSYLRTGKWNVL